MFLGIDVFAIVEILSILSIQFYLTLVICQFLNQKAKDENSYYGVLGLISFVPILNFISYLAIGFNKQYNYFLNKDKSYNKQIIHVVIIYLYFYYMYFKNYYYSGQGLLLKIVSILFVFVFIYLLYTKVLKTVILASVVYGIYFVLQLIQFINYGSLVDEVFRIMFWINTTMEITLVFIAIYYFKTFLMKEDDKIGDKYLV